MNKSVQCEILAALWLIAAVLCFGFGFKFAAFVALVLFGVNTWHTATFAADEYRKDKELDK